MFIDQIATTEQVETQLKKTIHVRNSIYNSASVTKINCEVKYHIKKITQTNDTEIETRNDNSHNKDRPMLILYVFRAIPALCIAYMH